MSKLYLSFFLLLAGVSVLAQDTTAPILNKSNRIILHFTDTTGKFMQLTRLLIDRGYDIEMKDRELGILRTKPSPLRGGYAFSDQLEVKTLFRDSTITFSGVTYSESTGHDFVIYQVRNEVSYSKTMYRNIMLSWEELGKIAELLKPAFITYSTVDVTRKAQRIESWYRRHN
ncbi:MULTISPECIES: hypothetical protein [Niastella]|uniref:Uncharacterized protein n=1 Tax=Niastella soli TaxID=2821487 RepID=A0ABS3YXZ6_9BACT|nr:hypothetical protein [Niastella soli]MBO9202805.1 hypothetical protein [Niastella soli]